METKIDIPLIEGKLHIRWYNPNITPCQEDCIWAIIRSDGIIVGKHSYSLYNRRTGDWKELELFLMWLKFNITKNSSYKMEIKTYDYNAMRFGNYDYKLKVKYTLKFHKTDNELGLAVEDNIEKWKAYYEPSKEFYDDVLKILELSEKEHLKRKGRKK